MSAQAEIMLETYKNKLQQLSESFPDYRMDAYVFISEAVAYTVEKSNANSDDSRHISGRELLDGFKQLALQQFGPLALDVLQDWGIKQCEDVGILVFRLVENGLLGARDEDSPVDFQNGFDFQREFLNPFVNQEKPEPPQPID
jgi:uncharacterized repeat protein (TIGR04138 family)